MAVLIKAEVQGQTRQGSNGMFGLLSGGLKQAPGFVLHTAHTIKGGWRIRMTTVGAQWEIRS